MRRMMIVGMLVALLVAALATAAMAQGQGQGRGQGEESGQGRGQGRGGADSATFNFKGTVESASSDAVVVAVGDGNKKARAFEGQEVSFAVDENTRIKDDDDAVIAATDLVPGAEVRVQSKAPRDASEFTARKIDVKDDLDD